jgi:GT2 family glycosyltransferase
VSTVDVVVVSYNSSETLKDCVEPLPADWVNVIVVDNASADDTLETVAGLRLSVVKLDRNHGFAYGCNRGWEAGTAPYVLFLNPDARIDHEALRTLVDVLERNERAALVGPRIVDADGVLDHSQRRFPTLRSTYAQALFLHRLFPTAPWADEVVHDPRLYESAHAVEWISGACILTRRSALEQIGGWDEGFFFYSEDKDLCRRLWNAGYELLYEPAATIVHVGGASAPRARMLPTLAFSRIRYARKHEGAAKALLERVGIAVGSLTHAALTTQGRAARMGHLKALGVALRPDVAQR